jgi:hypothetical protein
LDAALLRQTSFAIARILQTTQHSSHAQTARAGSGIGRGTNALHPLPATDLQAGGRGATPYVQPTVHELE